MITQAALQGHWRRDWITAPGFEDRTTRVHWLQAGALFADLRIPAVRPDVTGHTCLADLGAPALRALMQAEGFAGQITVEGDRCTWHRWINWHGVPGQADIGAMSFDATGALIEDGVLAEYRELWQAVPGAPMQGLRLRSGETQGVLIANDALFALGLGPPPAGTTEALIAALEHGTANTTALAAHFASAYVLGRWDGAQGIATLSTNPFLEGRLVLERGAAVIWHDLSFHGHHSAQPLTTFPISDSGDAK